MSFEKISAKQAFADMAAGDAVLVNGYDEPSEWEKTRVEGATSFADFKQQPGTAKEREVIFYCACPNDETAVKRAEEYSGQGWTNVKVVDGGVEALRSELKPPAAANMS